MVPIMFPALIATAQEDQKAKYETGDVPTASVVHFVYTDIMVEQGDDQRDRRDQAVPQAQPETGWRSFNAG